jgi:hypothetical protein
LPLVRLYIDDEDESVVFFNLLHCRLSVERIEEDVRGIEAWLVLSKPSVTL